MVVERPVDAEVSVGRVVLDDQLGGRDLGRSGSASRPRRARLVALGRLPDPRPSVEGRPVAPATSAPPASTTAAASAPISTFCRPRMMPPLLTIRTAPCDPGSSKRVAGSDETKITAGEPEMRRRGGSSVAVLEGLGRSSIRTTARLSATGRCSTPRGTTKISPAADSTGSRSWSSIRKAPPRRQEQLVLIVVVPGELAFDRRDADDGIVHRSTRSRLEGSVPTRAPRR